MEEKTGNELKQQQRRRRRKKRRNQDSVIGYDLK